MAPSRPASLPASAVIPRKLKRDTEEHEPRASERRRKRRLQVEGL